MKYILIIALSIMLAGCGDDGRDNVATPLPPDKPVWYTPVATADYH